MTFITTKRVYDPIDNNEAVRVLVDRLRPRGISKQTLKADHWLREVAPSDQLRQWFGHDPSRWEEFKHRYFEELQAKPKRINYCSNWHVRRGSFYSFPPVTFTVTRRLPCNNTCCPRYKKNKEYVGTMTDELYRPAMRHILHTG